MAFGTSSIHPSTRSSAPMAEINIIPLVDVMLVLLVIFIVTAPLLTHAVKIDLPQASSTPNLTKPDNIQLAIDETGAMYWNGEPVARAELLQRLREAGSHVPGPELHLHVDRNTRYEVLAEVLSEASKEGIAHIGFVTTPQKEP